MDYDYWIRVDRSGLVIQHMHEVIAQSRLHPEAKTLSDRRAIYREVFDLCLRRGGYISRGYVDGLWDHLVYERPRSLARVLRGFPRLRRVIVSVHWRWLNRHLYTRRQWVTGSARLAKRLIVRGLRRRPRLFAVLLRMRNGLWALRARLAVLRREASGATVADKNGRRVSGYWPDNWVEEKLEVVVDARERDTQFRIAGRPIAQMTVEVSANGTQLGRFELAGEKQETVTVRLPAGPRERVSFSFSNHSGDAAGRPISFLLEETNLFREEDLHPLA